MLQQLRAAGITVVMLDEPADDRGCAGDTSGRSRLRSACRRRANGSSARTQQEIDAATASASRRPPTPLSIAFLYLRGPAGIYLITGEGAGPDAMIEAIGARDAGARAGHQRASSPSPARRSSARRPTSSWSSPTASTRWAASTGCCRVPGVAQTPAGEQRRIVDMDDGVLLNFGTRTGAAIEALAKAVYQPCG